MKMKTTIHWHPVGDLLPDDDLEVILALTDGVVTSGWRDGSHWMLAPDLTLVAANQLSGVPLRGVLFWAQMPAHPAADDLPIPYTLTGKH